MADLSVAVAEARAALSEDYEQGAQFSSNAQYDALVQAANQNVLPPTQESATRETILQDLKDTHAVLSRIPFGDRLDLMTEFENAVMPQIQDALALMITANVGKSIKAATGEMGKASAWFGFLAAPEQQRIFSNYRDDNIGVKTGLHIRNSKGKAITDIEQLSESVLATKYPDNINVTIPASDREINGNGLTFSQPPKNYPFALGVGDILLSMFAGNATVMKLPSDMSDVFETFINHWNQHVVDYATKHQSKLGLSSDDIATLEKRKTVYATTDYGWEEHATNARVVSSLGVGESVYAHHQDSTHISEEDKKRFSAELAGANILYVGDDLTNEEYGMCADKWLGRVVDNMGMICTKIEDAMVKKGENGDKFRQAMREKFTFFDKTSIGNPYDDNTTHGMHTDPQALDTAESYLEECRKIGAEVIGGERLNANQMTPAVIIWDEIKKPDHIEQRRKNLENFAPITNLMMVDDVNEAIAITNESQCNLTCSLWTHDTDEIGAFYHNTNIGSYNIFNPKHGSDNAPYGEHMAVYQKVKWIDQNGDEHELDIPVNAPTGGHAHIAHHLNVEPQYPQDTISISAGHVTPEFTLRTLIKAGADLKRDTELSDNDIRTLAKKHNIPLNEMAPSLAA